MTQITNEDTHALFWEDSFYTLWLGSGLIISIRFKKE